MESTGIYWIPVFEILESHGLEVKLVNARRAGLAKLDRCISGKVAL
ncbi:MAG: hypothetical protein Q7J27_09430 [Syntrophales bacterium]|nr:hypothetical protein [Syntrophales bacterium]